ncbi:MAG: BirA family biotin operon repressor/biotin-[acetyl-CoA-carboxylase] ligase [Cryomorphaceae bacterium]|jgi:BirA family biotin operon repressor/biotin-[acetyl-CoA-carboxylase] ligase
MQKADHLLHLLNNTRAHDNEALGRELGLSKMQMKQTFEGLAEQGLPLRQNAKGDYCVQKGIHLLDAEEIAEVLRQDFPLDSFELFQSLNSTNSHLLSQTFGHGRARVCLTESQLAGRGRRGNEWLSAPYRNIMMSVSWGFASWPSTITGLGLAVALSVTKVLNERYGLEVKIKWPNDLLVNDDKLAGILIDVAGDASGACNVVIGLGLNVDQPDWSDCQSAAYRWQDLNGLGIKLNRNVLIAQILNSLTQMLQSFESAGFEPLVGAWNSLSSYAHRRIRVGSDTDFICGEMAGVDSIGALMLDADDGTRHRFTDSNVSVRLMPA